jgi:hypothetical protein
MRLGLTVTPVQHSASRSLAIFGHDSAHVGKMLMRIALTGNTPSAAAVLYSIFALSSLHRYGCQEQAFEFKISTLRALANMTMRKLTATETIQHVAAGMLLCSFEVSSGHRLVMFTALTLPRSTNLHAHPPSGPGILTASRKSFILLA